MNPRIEALLAVDPRDLTDAERTELDAALAADEDALETALAVAADAALLDQVPDPIAIATPVVATEPAANQTAWFAVAAAVVLVAVVAVIIALRSSPDEERTVETTPDPPPRLDERDVIAPAPVPREADTDGLRAWPTGAARPKPLRAAAASESAARAHAARGLKHKNAGDHRSAAFAYVDAFRALPSEPALAYTAAAEMERAGQCADAITWFQFAVSLAPGADFASDANARADALEGDCDGGDAVIDVIGPSAAESRARYDHGRTLYAAGDYRSAARMFGSAYQGWPVPDLAYNVAAAYESADDCANAGAWFGYYLAVAGDADDRSSVENKIAAYETARCAGKVTHAPPTRDTTTASKQPVTEPRDVTFPEPAADSDTLPERLGRADITKPISAARDDIQACGADAGFVGTMKVKMRIDPDGTVGSAEASEPGAVGTCVEGVVRGVKFRRAKKPISVSYPFVFR
jgi:tetratricopeptide (TPR) repeat protein